MGRNKSQHKYIIDSTYCTAGVGSPSPPGALSHWSFWIRAWVERAQGSVFPNPGVHETVHLHRRHGPSTPDTRRPPERLGLYSRTVIFLRTPLHSWHLTRLLFTCWSSLSGARFGTTFRKPCCVAMFLKPFLSCGCLVICSDLFVPNMTRTLFP